MDEKKLEELKIERQVIRRRNVEMTECCCSELERRV